MLRRFAPVVLLVLALGVPSFPAADALAADKLVVWWNKGYYPEEDAVLRRADRGADDAHPLLARSAARGRDGGRPGQGPDEVGRLLDLLEEGAGRAPEEGSREVRQALRPRHDRVHARQRHPLQLRDGAALVQRRDGGQGRQGRRRPAEEP